MEETSHNPVRLATETALALRALDPDDETGHKALAHRLNEAGITRSMHADRLPRPRGQRMMTSDMPPQKMLEIAQNNLASAYGARLTTLDWPRDQRIEYELGQLLWRLEQGGPAGWEKPGQHVEALERFHDRLLELRDLPDMSEPQPPHIPGVGQVAATGTSSDAEAERLRAELRGARARIADLEGQLAEAREANTPALSPEALARVQKILQSRRENADHGDAPDTRNPHPHRQQQRPTGPDSGPPPGIHR
ncbi:hypothetical protein [Streptomyces botrytidirepellens]|uniref:hypothetical protein n=1 Tax=Streptomyces botrytidirepellens TaxID=2486417 RepID=UPI0011CD6DDF|nr:hypothetical protein [Streptomyces botrytidirepellens]